MRIIFFSLSNEGRRRPSLIAACNNLFEWDRVVPNEGRRRPSLIAAGNPRFHPHSSSIQRGAPAPLPHCGSPEVHQAITDASQRGAPAPLPHCGVSRGSGEVKDTGATRGAGAPPSLRRGNRRRLGNPPAPNEGRRRPSLIAANPWMIKGVGIEPNEGRRRPSLIAAFDAPAGLRAGSPTRGAGAPPSLRQDRPVG